MTLGCQPNAFAAATKPGFNSEHAAAEQLRKATLIPFCGACGRGVEIGICVGSVAAAATSAFARSRPLPPASAVAAAWLTDAGAPVLDELPLPLDLHAVRARL